MNFEDFQKSWRRQDAGARISIDPDLLLKEVRRNQRNFSRTIFWRDTREVGLAVALIPVFILMGLQWHDWTDYLVALAGLFIAGFIVIDRQLQKRKTPEPNDSLAGCVKSSLAEVGHQIWLLKNVGWWYLLPVGAALMFSVFWDECRSAKPPAEKCIDLVISTLFIALLYLGLYWLNQFAVRKSLEPRRQELQGLLASLE